jgi:hypothetical protein
MKCIKYEHKISRTGTRAMSKIIEVEFLYYDDEYIHCSDRTNTMIEQHRYWHEKFEKLAGESMSTGSFKYFSPLQIGTHKFRVKKPKNMDPLLKPLISGVRYRLHCKIIHGKFKVGDQTLFGWRITNPEFHVMKG